MTTWSQLSKHRGRKSAPPPRRAGYHRHAWCAGEYPGDATQALLEDASQTVDQTVEVVEDAGGAG